MIWDIGWNIVQYHFGCLEHDICTSANKPFKCDKTGSLLAPVKVVFREGKGLPKLFANF